MFEEMWSQTHQDLSDEGYELPLEDNVGGQCETHDGSPQHFSRNHLSNRAQM